MSLFRCFDCGNTFGADEIATVKEDRGEFWGERCYENISVCPFCGSPDFGEFEDGDENDSETD